MKTKRELKSDRMAGLRITNLTKSFAPFMEKGNYRQTRKLTRAAYLCGWNNALSEVTEYLLAMRGSSLTTADKKLLVQIRREACQGAAVRVRKTATDDVPKQKEGNQ